MVMKRERILRKERAIRLRKTARNGRARIEKGRG